MEHPHAELIHRWTKNMTQAIQCRKSKKEQWKDVSLHSLTWDINKEYRFKPKVLRHRVAYMKNDEFVSVSNEDQHREVMNRDSFGYWLSPWKEVEIKDIQDLRNHSELVTNNKNEAQMKALAMMMEEA